MTVPAGPEAAPPAVAAAAAAAERIAARPARTAGVRVAESLLAARERKRLLDAMAVLAVAVSVLTLVGPWFFRVIDVEMVPVARAAVVYAALYLAAALAADGLRSAPALTRAMQLLQLSLVPFLAWLWHRSGGVNNPMFLLAFFLPVAASGAVLVRWQPFATALLSALLAWLVALLESPQLAWYLTRAGLPVERALALLPALPGVRLGGGPELASEPGFLAFTLVAFTTLLLASAFLAQAVTRVLLRLTARLDASAEHLDEVRNLFQAVLKAEPEPGVIVYADSAQVVDTSTSFLTRMLLEPDAIVGRSLFELVAFSQPERVRAALASGGPVPFAVYLVGGERRVANLSVHTVAHGDSVYAYVGFEDLTEQYYLTAAFDAIDEPVLVVGADGLLRYANRAAEDAFGALHLGMDAGEALDLPSVPAGWWRGVGPQEPRRLEIDGHPYRATAVGAKLPGEEREITILTLRSIAEEEALAEQASLDPLTGLYNRRFFELSLPHHVALAERGTAVTLAYLDLDDFKEINDRLGHAAGDAGLLAVSRAVRGELRATDVFARLGGDEFAILFNGLEPHEASIVIDRMYRRLERQPLAAEDGERRALTFSASVVAVRPGEPVDRLMGRADRLMYEAKQAGKGRCLAEA